LALREQKSGHGQESQPGNANACLSARSVRHIELPSMHHNYAMHVGSHAKILANLLKRRDREAPAVAVFHRRWCFSASVAVAL
jgi:hypothetical protein